MNLSTSSYAHEVRDVQGFSALRPLQTSDGKRWTVELFRQEAGNGVLLGRNWSRGRNGGKTWLCGGCDRQGCAARNARRAVRIVRRRVLGWVLMVDRPHIVVVAGGRVLTVVMPRSHAKAGRHRGEALQRHGERDGNEEQKPE
jgi:hypothetical protein